MESLRGVNSRKSTTDLVKGFVTESTLERFVPGVREPMTLVVALLVKSFAANVTDERLDSLVDAPVGVERR